MLHTIDKSDFNIIISNTQKIIVKKKHKQESAINLLFSFKDDPLLSKIYGEIDSSNIDDNYRFQKLCRLKQLGVYVDEAHHLFGADLERQIRSGGKNKTSLRDTINILASKTNIVACYNYTGTPYIESQLLPEVVYAYGLRESIMHGYLKDAEPLGFDNVKSAEFLKGVIKRFWEDYGTKTYEGLNPKIAIYAASIDEAVNEVRPELEKILADLDISPSKILVNVGDEKYTRNDDIRDFNNLDIPGTTGNEKQFIILVEKGKEGWNCRSLFGVALYRSPKSKIFVLQAVMRCLRSITRDKLTAVIFLSHENFKILDDELHKNFNMDINELHDKNNTQRKKYHVKFLPPTRKITLKQIKHEYSLHEKIYFEKYITSENVSEIYFTGMFTAGQGDLSVSYYDPESGRLRQYYPDFLARMQDGTYRLIEVKAAAMIDDSIVKAKADAAKEMASESKIEYLMYSGSDIIRKNIII